MAAPSNIRRNPNTGKLSFPGQQSNNFSSNVLKNNSRIKTASSRKIGPVAPSQNEPPEALDYYYEQNSMYLAVGFY